jgi:hypothetical protein
MVCFCQLLKRMDKNGSGNAELFQALFDGLRQYALALSRQPHENVRSGAGPLYQIVCLGAVDEFDGAVMMTSKLLRKRANRRFDAFGKASDRKQQLILSRLDSGRLGRLVAEIQILLDAMPEFGQRAVIGIPGGPLAGGRFSCHATIS